MKTRAVFVSPLAVFLSLTLLIPPEVAGQAGPRAGQVSGVIPTVNIQRGSQQLPAVAQAPVFWEDLITTARMARARITLDDGSILNVGSESSLRVAKHDPGAQQTELELTYGRLRSRAVRITRPAGNFEIRTPVGIAGVVGTDFFLSYANSIMQLIVLEGVVRFCNLNGQCVNVGAGQMSTVRANQQPDAPTAATPSQLTEAVQSTELEPGERKSHRHVPLWLIILLGGVAVTAIAVPLATRGGTERPPCPHPLANGECPR